jgi:cell division transport system permease protein
MQLRYVFSELRQGLRRNFSMHLAVILTLFVSLTLVGLGVLLNAQAKKAEDHFGSLLQITVFLCNDAATSPNCTGEVTAAQKDAIIKVVKENPEVASYHTESKQEAYDKAKELFSEEYLSRVDSFGPQSMKESVWIDLKDAQEYTGILSAVQGLDGVSHVRDQRAVLKPIYATIDSLKYGAIGIAVFLIAAALMLVANTIRLAAFARRREIGIMRLVGASSLYISLPFLMEALVTALVGVVLAGGALGAFMWFGVHEGIRQSINFMPWIGLPEYLTSLVWIAVLGPLLTLIPTLVLTRKYLKV